MTGGGAEKAEGGVALAMFQEAFGATNVPSFAPKQERRETAGRASYVKRDERWGKPRVRFPIPSQHRKGSPC